MKHNHNYKPIEHCVLPSGIKVIGPAESKILHGKKFGASYYRCPICGEIKVTINATLRKGKMKTCPSCKHHRPVTVFRYVSKGYVFIYKPDHHEANASGYIKEHRWVMEQYIGRDLFKGEVVHHKDFNRSNNAIDNLQLMSSSEHSRLHARIKAEMMGYTIRDKNRVCKKCGCHITGKGDFCIRCMPRTQNQVKYDLDDIVSIVRVKGFWAAARKYGVSNTSIYKFLRKNGVSIKREKKPKIAPVKRHSFISVNPKTNETKFYHTINDVREDGHVCTCVLRVCHGERKLHHGLIWKFQDGPFV